MKWLFLVHQLQTSRSRERVKIWWLTRKTGAVLYRNSVYVLPFSQERLEDLPWLCQQIRDTNGEDRTFETLPRSFQLKDKALSAIAEMVHDIDVKDEKFGRPEAAGLDVVVRGLADALKNDHQLLEIDTVILDALHSQLSFKRPKA